MQCAVRGGILMLVAAVAALHARPAHAQSTQSLPPRLADIQTRLGSDDFAVRQAAQAELAKIPPDQVETLRQAAKNEKDAEVRARLEQRVTEMELYTLIHPPALSIDVKDATLADVAAALNKQLGAEFVRPAPGGRTVTLRAVNEPFWQIMRELNWAMPLTCEPLDSITVEGTKYSLRIGEAAPGNAGESLFVAETFGVLVRSSARRAIGNWALQFTIHCDPRLRITRYSPTLRVEKITDQDGGSIVPLLAAGSNAMAISSRPNVSFSSSVSFTNSPPGLKAIRELRGSVAITLLESERTVTVDLTKGNQASVDSPRGKITVEKSANGDYLLKIAASAAPGGANASTAAAGGLMTIRTLDQDGVYFRMQSSSGTQITVSGAALGNHIPTTAQIIMTDKTRDIVLPVELSGFDLGPVQGN